MKTQEASAITVSAILLSWDVGECEGCSRYGTANHYVYRVRLFSNAFRLCPNCKDDLLAMLKKLEP